MFSWRLGVRCRGRQRVLDDAVGRFEHFEGLVFLVHQNEDRGIPGFVELELAQPMRLAFVAKHSAALDLQSLGCAGAS